MSAAKSPKRIEVDLDGAPFKIGNLVRVARSSDSTADARFVGRCGRVVYFEYSCGCGQSYPEDPMIGVQFGTDVEEFWREEVELLGADAISVVINTFDEAAS